MRSLTTLVAFVATLFSGSMAYAFCGFYVARADTQLFNQASQVVLVRDGERTVMTMANDYRGDAKDFAVVIPVPTVLEREQIHVTEPALIEHLDAYTSPRLVEYHDPDPCRADALLYEDVLQSAVPAAPSAAVARTVRPNSA